MRSPGLTDIEVRTAGDVSSAQAATARDRMVEMLAGVTDEPLLGRITLRPGNPTGKDARFVSDASVLFRGRVLASHVTAATPLRAADEAIERLRRQLRRVVGANVAMRNEPRTVEAALTDLQSRPRYHPDTATLGDEVRTIVHRRTYADRPEQTLTAVADLLDLDLEFFLFRHARTDEDVVVHWRPDARIGLLFPPGSVLGDEDDIVVPEPSEHPDPLSLDTAQSELEAGVHRWLYFIDAADGRGKVLYLRHDGDLGLVEPGP